MSVIYFLLLIYLLLIYLFRTVIHQYHKHTVVANGHIEIIPENEQSTF